MVQGVPCVGSPSFPQPRTKKPPRWLSCSLSTHPKQGNPSKNTHTHTHTCHVFWKTSPLWYFWVTFHRCSTETKRKLHRLHRLHSARQAEVPGKGPVLESKRAEANMSHGRNSLTFGCVVIDYLCLMSETLQQAVPFSLQNPPKIRTLKKGQTHLGILVRVLIQLGAGYFLPRRETAAAGLDGLFAGASAIRSIWAIPHSLFGDSETWSTLLVKGWNLAVRLTPDT